MAFGEKPPKLVDLLEISNFLYNVPSKKVLTQLLAKCCKRYGIWWKTTKLVDLLEMSNFLCKVPCTRVWPNFEQNVAKSMAFGEKPPKLVDLLEISNFLCKVPCTRVLTQFLAKCCKKYGIWWKTTKTCRSPRNKQLFVQCTIQKSFDSTFSKMLQKVWHSVKNLQNLSISSKLATFCGKYRAVGVWPNF